MNIRSQKEQFVLLFGDIFFFLIALWVTLFVRNWTWPDWTSFLNHLAPFLIIFGVWLIVFFISDLYRSQTALSKKRLPATIVNTQIINSLIAVLFFYFIPYFGITPKITLFIDLFFSAGFILLWRTVLFDKLYKARHENVLFLCSGPEIDELIYELKHNHTYNVEVISRSEISDISKSNVSTVVINSYDKNIDSVLPEYYKMIFSRVRFIGAHNMYEEIFGRVAVGLINERWFLENISNRPKPYYDFFRRLVDIVTALILGVLSLVVYPFVYLAIKLTDGGSVFFSQNRVGKDKKIFKIYKFRSMKNGEVTTVGKFLRKTRLDELPQLWSVLFGDLSLIGPRPETPDYVETYSQDINFYDIRSITPPGLSGWAQIYHNNHPHHAPAVEQTKEKLSYDLYYVKNRSLWLDLTIYLKTLKTIFLVKGK